MNRKVNTCLALLVFLLSFALQGHATNLLTNGMLTGNITDKSTGKPIYGASIYIPDQRIGGASDASGHFIIEHISTGIHLVEVSHVGYETLLIYVDVQLKTVMDFILNPSIIENNAVVVTGSGKARELKSVPYQVVQLSGKELFQTTSTNIIDAISQKAGISSLSSGPSVSKPVIRGMGYNRVLTIHDGVRQEGQQWGDEHGIEIDDANISKIEILKGPASLVYGSDAMAGVIHILSNTTIPNNTIKLNAGAEYQTNNKLNTMHAGLLASKKGWSWGTNVNFKSAGDYQNKYDGYVFNSGFVQKNISGQLGYHAGWGYTHLLVSNFNLKTGMIGGERDSTGAFIRELGNDSTISIDNQLFFRTIQVPYQHINHFKVTSDNNIKISQQRLSLNVAFQRNERNEFGNPTNPEEKSLSMDLQTLTYNARFHFKERKDQKNELGITGMFQNNQNAGLEYIIPEYHLLDNGLYYYYSRPFHKFNLTGGARFDNRTIKVDNSSKNQEASFAPLTKSFANFSGGLGFAYNPNSTWTIKTNLARAFRAPVVSELSSNGAHEGTNRFEYGNVNLKSEISTQLDASVEFNNRHFNLNLSGYLNQFENYIFYRKLLNYSGSDSLVDVDGEQLTAFRFDQQAAKIFGMEATLDLHPHPLDWLHFENTFSLIRGMFEKPIEKSSNIPFMPAPRLLTQIRADFNSVSKKIRNLYVKLEVDRYFTQNRVFTSFNTETQTPGYILYNAGMGCSVFNNKGVERFSVAINVVNLTDEAYQNHLSRLKYTAENRATGRSGVFNMGRNIGLKINYPLSFKWK